MIGNTDTPRPLRILHLVDSLRVGGKERQIVELLKGLCRFSFVESIVVTMGAEQFYVADIEDLGVPLYYLLRKVRWDPTIFPRLWHIIRQFCPDIIHTNSEMAMSYAWPLARLMNIRIINNTIRNAFSGNGLRWRWHELMLHLADARVGNSKAGFASRGMRHDAPGNYVIHNGFDLQRFETAARAQRGALGCDPNASKVVGMVAEFSDYKDYPTFIRAAQKVTARRHDVSFLAVGGGKNLGTCQRLVSRGDRSIRFLGERKDVEEIVKQMDVGVLCTFSEGISNSVMEYMAAGKPVVVTDGGGSSELVVDGEHGFLVPASDPKAVARRLEFLLDHPSEARRMGAAGRRRLEEVFSLARLAENTVRMYRDVLGHAVRHVQRQPTS
jgi:glycosyltransferase involved in cell wall biosynthesis